MICGRASIGTPKRRHRSASHCPVARFISEVREAVATSVSNRPVRRSRKKASVVPRRSWPRACQRRRPAGRGAGSSQVSRPRNRGRAAAPPAPSPWPRASRASAAVTSAVRSSCQRSPGRAGGRRAHPRQGSFRPDWRGRRRPASAASRQRRTLASSSSRILFDMAGGGVVCAWGSDRTGCSRPRRQAPARGCWSCPGRWRAILIARSSSVSDVRRLLRQGWAAAG